MRYTRLLAVVAPLVGALGQGLPAQQATMPVRPLGAVIATSAEPIGTLISVRALSNGRVLLNDRGKRRVILFDSTLHVVTVADTTTATTKAYGRGLDGMIPYLGDSTLTLDELSDAFVVIDPAGRIARLIPPAHPPAGAARLVPGGLPLNYFLNPGFPQSGDIQFDRAGHIVFRAGPPTIGASLPQDFSGDTVISSQDSIAILRADLTTRRIDTIAELHTSLVRQLITRQPNGRGGSRTSRSSAVNPYPFSDDWALLSDGTMAVVRARDYHIDWIAPDGHLTSGPKITAQWVPLTDSMKRASINGIRARDSMAAAAAAARIAALPQATRDSMARDSADRVAAAQAGGLLGPLGFGSQRRVYAEPSDLPDYKPPFTSGSTRADAEGNLWVHVNEVAGPGPGVAYDVINRKGELIDRVQIPAGATLVGFGPGVAYLTMRVAGAVHLAKASIH